MVKHKITHYTLCIVAVLIFIHHTNSFASDAFARIQKFFTGNPTKNDCLPEINEFKDINASQKQELACLKAGHKKIWWGDHTVDTAEWEKLNFGILTCNKTIRDHVAPKKEQFVIIFAPDVKRNALLFQKYLLEQEIYLYIRWIKSQQTADDTSFISATREENIYALGAFLLYGDAHSTYYYRYQAYRHNKGKDLNKMKRETALNQFDAMPALEKAQLVNNWANQNDSWQTTLSTDKNAYQAWINLNQNISDDALAHQNKALNDAILLLNFPQSDKNVLHTDFKTTTTSQSQPSWWKKHGGYIATFAAGAAAVYAYMTSTKSTNK